MKGVLLIIAFFIYGSGFSQKVFVVNYASQADVKLFIVNYESQADLKVYKVKYQSEAGNNNGKWFFVN
jgi:hypothetical protein